MLEIERLENPSSEELGQIVVAYRQIFGGEPWGEGYKCPDCSAIFPLSVSFSHCPQCEGRDQSVELVDYWPAEVVRSDFCREMAKPGARCFVAKGESQIVGFAWGYELIVNDKIDEKLEAPGLGDILPWGATYFYGDELAVLSEFRHQKLGTKLLVSLFGGQGSILIRTLTDSSAYGIITRLGGRAILPISRGRVIMTIEQPAREGPV